MYDALGIGINRLGSVIARIVERSVIAEVVVACKTERPKHSRTSLVAYLYPLNINAVVLKILQYVGCMFCYGSLHLVEVVLEVVPCSRDVLLARVGP